MPAQRGDTIEADEVWAYVGNKKNQAWIWLSWSFQTTQTLSFAVGPRDEATGRIMWQGIPSDWKRKQVYTDALGIYDNLIPLRQHWVCPKGSAETNIAEGCNNYLRHRVSYLVRRSSSFARKIEWLYRRLYLVIFTRNMQIKQKNTHKQIK